MAYIMGKNGLTLGQKESNFKNQPFIVSNYCAITISAKNNLGHRWYTIGSRRGAMGVWSGPIGLKAKDPYWGGMGISVPGGIKITGGLTANF